MINKQIVDDVLIQLDDAIVALTKASKNLELAVGFRHDAWKAVEDANERARVARAKVQIMWNRVP